MKNIIFCILLLSNLTPLNAADTTDLVVKKTLQKLSYGTFKSVHQDEVAVLSPNSPFDLLFLGPLRPCQGIIINFGIVTIAYHRSSASSLKYLPRLLEHVREAYGIAHDEKPRVLLYSAKMSEKYFPTYQDAYLKHYGLVASQSELMQSVRLELASLLEMEPAQIILDLNESLESYQEPNPPYRKLYSADNIAIDKSGQITLAISIYQEYPTDVEFKRLFYCREALLAKHQQKGFLPPYMHAHDAPPAVEGPEGETFSWPSYCGECAFCGCPGADQIVGFMPKAIKGLPKLLRCSRCQKTSYCNADCQKNDWLVGHKTSCASSKSTRSVRQQCGPCALDKKT